MGASNYQYGRRAEEQPVAVHAEGIILLDANLNILAFDAGAASILKDETALDQDRVMRAPPRLMEALRERQVSERPAQRVRLHLGGFTYVCRIHVAPWRIPGLPGNVTALYLVREMSIDDTLALVSAEYRLTIREQQALRGVITGLSSKEVAEQMSISPNTVKAFLRLVMVKMGVNSRTGILTKVFDQNGHDE